MTTSVERAAPAGFTRVASWVRQPAGQMVLGSLCLLVLTLVVLGPVLFSSGGRVFSAEDEDLALQFVHWRAFGFGELRHGHLALWNPHIFCGTPYFGGFQAALLYPPNWLYLCLPLAVAINVGITLHVFLAGVFMQLWIARRGMHPLSGLLAGTLFMFSGPYFLHIYPGHLSNLCTMVWGPVIFLAIDGWLEQRRAGWLWVGAGAVALQILAGHPQYVFYTGIAAGLYCLCHLAHATNRLQAALGLTVIAAGAVALSAVQLFEGFHAAAQEVRNHGPSRAFAAIFSFPPENLVTLLAPGFFGDMTSHPYWGRFRLWEMSLFVGVSGFVLAIYGARHGERSQRRFCTGLAALFLVLALGVNTPLFELLYRYAPGFGKFRGWSKFSYPATLFLIVLAASGFDAIWQRRRLPTRRTVAVILLGGGALAAAAFLAPLQTHPWRAVIHSLYGTHELFQSGDLVESEDFARGAASFSARQLLLSGATLGAVGGVFWLARKRPAAVGALVAVASLEMLTFACSTLASFPLEDALAAPPAPANDADRLLNLGSPNLGMSTGTCDLWGYDPGVLRRYAEWIAVTQGLQADDATELLTTLSIQPTFATLLRCRAVFYPPGDDGEYAAPLLLPGVPAARLTLVSTVRIIPDRDRTFQAMQAPDFDPSRCVILAAEPDPTPVPDELGGRVRLVGETSDALTVDATLAQPSILLVSDTYCSGWRARSLLPAGETVQPRYDVLPADYFLRAIPLRAGHHRLRLEYLPTAFVIGKWLSLVSLVLYLGAAVGLIVRRGSIRRLLA